MDSITGKSVTFLPFGRLIVNVTRLKVDYFTKESKLLEGPVRWTYWAVGLFAIWHYQAGNLSANAALGLSLYLGLNVTWALIILRPQPDMQPYLVWGSYIADLLFASFVIHHTGGIVSQYFLLYYLLPFKAAIYYPYVHLINYASFLIFPLYALTLYLDAYTFAFITDNVFAPRYALLLLTTGAGIYTAWHLDSRQQQSRALLAQLEVEHRRIDQRRRELRTVLDSIGDGVLVVNPDMQLLMINPVAADIFNLSYPPPLATSLGDLIDNSSLLDLLRRTLQSADDKAEMLSDEIATQPNSAGKAIICHARATALVSNGVTPHGAVVVLRDMTRQKELKDLKNNFISMLSHELRTPLTITHGFIELLLNGAAGDITSAQREHLETILTQMEHLDSLINALLEFAEMEANQSTLHLAPISVDKLIYKVLGRVEPLAENHGIALQANIAPNIAPLYADHSRIEQLLLNLLDNAIKFTPQHGQVTVTASDQGDKVQVCVIDNGPGVPPAERDRIFERFYQIDSSSTRSHGGTGMGLAISKHIVELHRGRIWVEDPAQETKEPGGPGSRFCFTIPHNLAQQTDEDQLLKEKRSS